VFRRVFIANRGVVAARIVRACDKLGVESVAAYSDIDARAPHLQAASSASRLPGYTPEDTYLNVAALIGAAKEAHADALHPGSEVIDDEAALLTAVRDIGFPVILKPVVGGGGIGIFVAASEKGLGLAFKNARTLSELAFGENGVYLQKYLSQPRHIEIQMLGDASGAISLFECDCSVQRRHQKLIEEAPAPNVDREALDAVVSLATNVLTEIGYENLATIETLLDGNRFGFLETNTRLQVEHGVTEEVTGVDLVTTQIRLAAGETIIDILPQEVVLSGYAVEVRVYAEDSARLLPSTGHLNLFRPPKMEGVRVEVGYREGQHVTPYYDPLLATVIGSGMTREQAIGRTIVALKAFEVDGVESNRDFLKRVLESEPFIKANLHTGIVNDLL
jgi:acetyl-CoA carboxylase biotin carboxylase subunit